MIISILLGLLIIGQQQTAPEIGSDKDLAIISQKVYIGMVEKAKARGCLKDVRIEELNLELQEITSDVYRDISNYYDQKWAVDFLRANKCIGGKK